MQIKRALLIIGASLVGIALFFLWLGVLTSEPAAAQGHIHTVCLKGPPTCDFSLIQEAIDEAEAGDIVKIASGKYTEMTYRYGLVQVIYLDKSITLQGGYQPGSWETPDPDANPTILDACDLGRVLTIAGSAAPTVKGLRLTAGDATTMGWSQGGGGVLITNAGGMLADNMIYGNHAYQGGGILLDKSTTILRDNTIISNTAHKDGGGVYLRTSPSRVFGNTIAANTAQNDRGGGLALEKSEAIIQWNIIHGNKAKSWGGGIIVMDKPAWLANNQVFNNTAQDTGGGINLWYSASTVHDNQIYNNQAPHGGGLYLISSAGELTGNLITGNQAEQQGGGVWLDSSDAILTSNIVANNQAKSQGAGIFVWGARPHLLHTTIFHNFDGDGSGVFVATDGSKISRVTMTNTILVNQTVGILVEGDNEAYLAGTLWGSGSWDNLYDWRGTGTIEIGSVNFWGNPGFVNAANGDFHLRADSDAIDRGVDSGVPVDIDHEPCPYLGPDIGADEYWPPGTLQYAHLPIISR